MPTEGFKSITVKQRTHDVLKTYQRDKRLRSLDQAIEWLLAEAGYEPLDEELDA